MKLKLFFWTTNLYGNAIEFAIKQHCGLQIQICTNECPKTYLPYNFKGQGAVRAVFSPQFNMKRNYPLEYGFS